MKRLTFIFAAIASATFAAFAQPASAATSNPAAERYVNENANAALVALSTPNQASREQKFLELFQRFADLQGLSNFVLGPQGAAQLRSDPALSKDWQAAFLDYASAVYQTQLDRFRGTAINVTGSVERIPGQDVIVDSKMTPRAGGKSVTVRWRILKRGDAWKVLDVAIRDTGNEIWLAQQQKRDFAPILGPRGDVRALIAAVRQQTANMRAKLVR